MEKAKGAKKPWPLLFLSFVCLIALIYIVITIPPQSVLTVGTFNFSYLLFFFPLVFLMIYGLVGFLFKSALQGVLFGAFIVVFLLFRFFQLTHPFFTILLFVIFFCIEGVMWKRK